MSSIPKIPHRLERLPAAMPAMAEILRRRPGDVKFRPILVSPLDPSRSPLNKSIFEQVIKLKEMLSQRAVTSGFHQFLLETIDFSAVIEKLPGLNEIARAIVGSALSDLDEANLMRKSFILMSYIDYFSRASKGEMRLLDEAEIRTVFEGPVPATIMAVGVIGEGAHQRFEILFEEGNIVKSRLGVEQINFRKGSWRLNQGEYAPDDFFRLFLDQMIRDQGAENSIFIRGSVKKMLTLAEGRVYGRTWFSLLRRYADDFINLKGRLDNLRDRDLISQMEELGLIAKATDSENYSWQRSPHQLEIPDTQLRERIERVWHNDPANTMLMRIELTKDAYLELLWRFRDKINERQLEGFHKIPDSSTADLIAKIEKSSPNVAISDPSLLGQFRVVVDGVTLDGK